MGVEASYLSGEEADRQSGSRWAGRTRDGVEDCRWGEGGGRLGYRWVGRRRGVEGGCRWGGEGARLLWVDGLVVFWWDHGGITYV